MPALRNSSEPITSKLAASSPARVIVLLPRASSLMEMSATLIRLVVGVFSTRKRTALARLRAVGASLTSRSSVNTSAKATTLVSRPDTASLSPPLLGSPQVTTEPSTLRAAKA